MSILIEQNVLGAILMGGLATYDQVSPLITPDMFLRHNHKEIYRVISNLAEEGTEIDVVTVGHDCNAQVADLMYLGALVKDCPTKENAILYAKSLQGEKIKRKMISGMAQLQAQIVAERDCTKSVQMLVDFTDSITESIFVEKEPRLIKEVMKEVVEDISAAYDSGGEIIGVATGFKGLDYMLSGLEAGQVMILAGRPGSGKTTLAFNIAENVALDGKSVMFISLEMSGAEVGKKAVSSFASLNSRQIKTGTLNDEELTRLSGAVGTLADTKLIIDDKADITIGEMKTRARMQKRKHGLDLVVIDYIQLLEGKGINRTEQIGHISRNIKLMAKELDVPVIALSQLSRNLESRSNKRPMLSDLRESGAIEQDADIVAFIYRDEYYNPDTPDKGLAEINIAKQREGETGVVVMETDLAKSKFMDTNRRPGH